MAREIPSDDEDAAGEPMGCLRAAAIIVSAAVLCGLLMAFGYLTVAAVVNP